jgi:hypothetical protein
MNTLDMYTREKANQLHLEGLQHQAQSHHMLRNAWQDRHLENAVTKRRLPLTLTFTALGLLFGSLLIAFATRLW